MATYGGVNVTTTLKSTSAKSAVTGTCTKQYHHWCLDGTSLTPAGVRGIIAGGVLFLASVAALSVYYIRKRR